MKKIVISGLLLAFAATPVMAEEGPGANSGRGSIREELDAKRAELKDKIRMSQDKLKESRERLMGTSTATSTKALRKEAKEEAKGLKKEVKEEVKNLRKEANEFRKDFARERTDVALRVFNANIERLGKLVERIESRIAKVKSEGRDTVAAEAAVADAKADIVDAKARMAGIGSITATSTATTTATSTTATSTARANFELVKSEVKLIRESLTDAKKSLMRAVQLLKGLGKNASTTPEVEDEREDD